MKVEGNYNQDGYIVYRNFFAAEGILTKIIGVAQRFHSAWKKVHHNDYRNGAINSAYLTSPEHLSHDDRITLWSFIASRAFQRVLQSLPIDTPAFLNAQLFFNPHNPHQKNYWHRDSQYVTNIKGQRAALAGPAIVHFRIPLANEPGLEIVPGTHRRWDTQDELDVRLEQSGRRCFEDLPSGRRIALNAGDLMIFSAHLIHRGLYGGDRLALDVIFCEAIEDFLRFARVDCLPDDETIAGLENGEVFISAYKIKE